MSSTSYTAIYVECSTSGNLKIPWEWEWHNTGQQSKPKRLNNLSQTISIYLIIPSTIYVSLLSTKTMHGPTKFGKQKKIFGNSISKPQRLSAWISEATYQLTDEHTQAIRSDLPGQTICLITLKRIFLLLMSYTLVIRSDLPGQSICWIALKRIILLPHGWDHCRHLLKASKFSTLLVTLVIMHWRRASIARKLCKTIFGCFIYRISSLLLFCISSEIQPFYSVALLFYSFSVTVYIYIYIYIYRSMKSNYMCLKFAENSTTFRV